MKPDRNPILPDGLNAQSVLNSLRQRETACAGPMDMREKGRYIAKHFPEIAQRAVSLADEALQGRLVLPGAGPAPCFVGNPPNWKENPSGDDEYIYQLNRMEHWRTMLEAYSITGNECYARKVIQELSDWLTQNPCPPLRDGQGGWLAANFEGPGTWRALEAGIRAYRTWPSLIGHLIHTPFLDGPLWSRLLESIYTHCIILYEIAPRLWPEADHNHFLMESLGLLSFSSMFRELCGAEKWRETAIKNLERCIERQVTQSGGQLEGSPSYHNGCVHWFSLGVVLARKYGLEISPHYRGKLKKMFYYSLYSTRPCGGNSPWGDSHTAQKETLSLAAVGCYMAFGDAAYLRYARHFYPIETILSDLRTNLWQIPDLPQLKKDLAACTPLRPALPVFSRQKELKQVFLRTGWGHDAISLMAACRSPVQNTHAHIDVGGFDLTAFGSPLICDPGIYTYKDDGNRKNFKSAFWHNCLTINRENPWEYKGSWSYGPQKWGDILWAEDSGRMQAFTCRHINYEPARATRAIALIEKRIVLVFDAVTGLSPDDSVQIHFHLDRTNVHIGANNLVTSADAGKSNAVITCSQGVAPTLLKAKVSEGNDQWHDSVIVRYESPCAGTLYDTPPLADALSPPPEKEEPPQKAPRGAFASACVIIPLRPGQAPEKVGQPAITLTPQGVKIFFTAFGSPYSVTIHENIVSLSN